LAAAVDSLGGVIDGHVVPTWGVEEELTVVSIVWLAWKSDVHVSRAV